MGLILPSSHQQVYVCIYSSVNSDFCEFLNISIFLMESVMMVSRPKLGITGVLYGFNIQQEFDNLCVTLLR